MPGRPRKKGLDWFKKDVSWYEDLKIMKLLDRYGPLGNTIFDCVLCRIYREGYYLEASPEELAFAVMKDIGSRWVKDKNLVLQVIYYCADIGLISKDLLQQNIITSAGLQRRYADVTSRNKVDKSLYWLIEKNSQPLKSIPSEGISDTEKPIFVTEKPISDTDMQQEKEVRNKKKEVRERVREGFASPTLEEVREYCKGKTIDPERFFKYYQGNGWVLSSGMPIVDWKSIADNWEKTEKKKSGNMSSFDISAIDNISYFSEGNHES